MNDSHPVHEPSLLDVQLAFEHWRLERSSSRQPTPNHLRSLAVALLEQHIPFTICKALDVNSAVLKQWALDDSCGEDQRAFVTLPVEPEAMATKTVITGSTVLIRLPNGVEIDVLSGFSLNQVLSVANSLRARPCFYSHTIQKYSSVCNTLNFAKAWTDLSPCVKTSYSKSHASVPSLFS